MSFATPRKAKSNMFRRLYCANSHDPYREPLDHAYRILMRWVLCLLVLASIGGRDSLGQDRALQQLPRSEAIYIWTDDFPSVLEQLQDAALKIDVVNQLWEVAEDQHRRRNSPTSSSPHLIEKLELLTSLWTQLHDHQLFDGQVVLILPVNAGSLIEQDVRRREAPTITSFICVAHTNSSAEDFKTFFTTLDAVSSRSSGRNLEKQDDREEEALAKVPGNWAVEGEWFCWTSTEVETLLTLDYLLGREVADQTLVDDRNFQTVFKNLKSQLSSDHQLSIYATSGALPFLAWQTTEAFAFANSVRAGNWKEMFLDELRGFGARLYLNSPTFVEELKSPIAIDAFLLMTRPRRGVLGAVGDRNSTGIQFDVPTLMTPMQRFSQIVFEENALFEGVAEVRERAQALRPNQDEKATPPRENPDTAIFSVTSRFAEMTFAARDNTAAGDVDSRNLLMAQISDPDRFETLFTLMTGGGLVAESPGRTDSPINDLPEEDVVVWRRSDKNIAELRQQILDQIASFEATLEQFSRSNDPQSREQIQITRQNIAALERRLQQEEERRLEPNLVMLHNWLMIWDFSNKENQQEVVDAYGSLHPQLVELEDNLQAMKIAFANRDSACGVVAFWADHLINRGKQLTNPPRRRQPANAPNEVIEPDPTVDATSDFLTTQVRKQIDKLLVTMSSDDDGFRINAALLAKPHDTVNQDKQ